MAPWLAVQRKKTVEIEQRNWQSIQMSTFNAFAKFSISGMFRLS